MKIDLKSRVIDALESFKYTISEDKDYSEREKHIKELEELIKEVQNVIPKI